MEAVGETGEGGFSYPPIQRHIRRCGLATHRIGSGAACGGGGSDSLGVVWEAGGSSSDAGEDEHGGGRDESGGHDLGERRPRRRSDEQAEDDHGWTGSSEDDDDDDDDDFGGNARNGGLVRSHIVPLFVRAPTYFSELLALGRVLYAIDRISGPRRTTNGAAGRARRQATAYCLTVVRMCCDVGTGGLDNAEPPNWMGGGRELDEGAGTLQRAQLLVDARLGEKLAPCLHDLDPDVRIDAMGCALSALRGGHERLRWISLSVRETEEVDPRALLALGFCSTVWVSAFAGLLRGGGAPATRQVNPSHPARQAGENAKRMALQCLWYMAAAGDLATHNWRGVRVLSALQGMINRGGASMKDESITAGGVGRRSSAAGDRESRNVPDFVGWKEGVLGVLQNLAENGSGEIHSMLRSQPGLGASFSHPDLKMNSESLLAPEGLASTAIELLRGAGTLGEIISLVRRTRSTLATAVRVDDRRVLGADHTGVPEDVKVTLSLVWGWMQRALVQLARDGSDHPSATARASLAWECLALVHFLLGSSTACRLARCKIHPDLKTEVSRSSGGVGGGSGVCEGSSSSDISGGDRTAVAADATSDLATARTGLETVVFLVSTESPVALDLYRAHPIPPLAVGAADALADSLTRGDRETVDALEAHGLGVRLGLAVEASTRLVRETRRLGVEEVHLLRTYPAGRRARVKLLDRILCQGGDRRGGRGLQEQVIVSGLLEFLSFNMLPDCTTTDVLSARLPASFVRHNGTPLVRNEGIALLERVVARRGNCPAIAREAARQAVRHDVPSAECARLRESRRKSVRAGVSACLRCLARLDSPAVDRMLSLTGVPQRAVLSARRDHAASKTRRQWARWIRHAATTGGNMQGGPVRRIPLLSSADPLGLSGEKPQTPAGHGRDLRDGTYDSQRTRPQVSQAPRAPPATEKVATREVQRSSSTADETRPRDAAGTGVGTHVSSSLSKNDIPEREHSAVLTIEGSLSTLSVPGLLRLLAAELAAAEETITVTEVGGCGEASASAISRQSHAAAGEAFPTSVDGSSVLKLSLPTTLASQLYTRCLAGVLRVPGLLYLEVRAHCTAARRPGYRCLCIALASCIAGSARNHAPRRREKLKPRPLSQCSYMHARLYIPGLFQVQGKGKLTWNGEEIVPHDESPLQLLPGGPAAPTELDGSRQPESPTRSDSPAGGSRTPAPAARSPSNTRFGRLSTVCEPSEPSARASDRVERAAQESGGSPVRSRAGVQADPKFSWLSRPSPARAERSDPDEDEDDGIGRDESGPTSTPLGSAATAATGRDLSPRAQQGRVATALDRMGAAVVEVRDAFQRWVVSEGPSAAAVRSPSSRTNMKRAVSFSDPETKAAAPTGNKTSLAGLPEEAMVRAMTDLRLPLQTAKDFCEGASGDGAAVTFSEFVSRYADASGLLKEVTPSDEKGGRVVWVEGSAGGWFAVPRKDLKDARRVFDEHLENQEDQDQESESSDGGEPAEGHAVVVECFPSINKSLLGRQFLRDSGESRPAPCGSSQLTADKAKCSRKVALAELVF